MPRDAEKLLEAELTKAIAAADEAEENYAIVRETVDAARRRLDEANADRDAIAGAIAALRKQVPNIDNVRAIVKDNRPKKEKPVA
jgi:hypothetical protein